MKLIIMGDLHYPGQLLLADKRVVEARDTFYTEYLEDFLAIEAQYHVSIGDLTHAGEPSEFEFIMSKVRRVLPEGGFLYALGNHDTYACSKAELQTLTGQSRYLAIEEEEAVLLVLDTARETPENWGGMIDGEQVEWLRSQMNAYGDKPLLVFAHHPVYGTTARSTETMMSLDPEVDVLSILSEHQGPGFFFNGHNHVQSIVRRGHWHFIQIAAVPDIPAVMIVNLEDQHIGIETVVLQGKPYRELVEIFAEGIQDYSSRPDAEGDEKAQSLNFSLSLLKQEESLYDPQKG